MYLNFENVLKYILVPLKMYLSTKYIDPNPGTYMHKENVLNQKSCIELCF